MSRRKHCILQIDDDPSFHREMRDMFQGHYIFEGAKNVSDLGRIILDKPSIDLVLLDLVLDDSGESIGLTLIDKIRAVWPNIPIIIITQDDRSSTTVEAMKAGANNYLVKSNPKAALWNQIFRTAIKQREENEKLKQELQKEQKTKEVLKNELQEEKRKNEYVNPKDNPFVGNSALIQTIKRTLKAVAEAPDVTVMITGETGVGKGVAARFLHANSSKRKDKPFQEINISTISQDLVPSQLFGHKKGSFTWALDDMKGRLELANQGIVFLDEIGDVSLENQVKLLEFVHNKTITPIGAKYSIKLDVQIVVSTNKNLIEEVKNGNFREDLFQRLHVFHVQIPPLRERREDILPLLAHFMKVTETEVVEEMEDDVLNFLTKDYSWPGNIRELENTVISMLIHRRILDSSKISFACLPSKMTDKWNNASIITPLERPLSIPEGTTDNNLRPLSGLNNLKYLDLSQNQIEETSPLWSLNALEFLSLESNQISELDQIRPFAQIHSLKELYLFGNPLNDFKIDGKLVNINKDNAMLQIRPIIFKTLNEEIAFKKLQMIEAALIQKNHKKKDVARMLGYKTDDNLRYAINKYLREYPHLSSQFPEIVTSYHRLLKKLEN